MRPTTAICDQSLAIADLERHLLALALAGRRRQRAQRRGGPALFPDHLAQIPRSDEKLDERHALMLRLDDPHLIGPIGQRASQHFDDGPHAGPAHAQPRAAAGSTAGVAVMWRAISVRTESDGRAPFLIQ